MNAFDIAKTMPRRVVLLFIRTVRCSPSVRSQDLPNIDGVTGSILVIFLCKQMGYCSFLFFFTGCAVLLIS